MGGQRSRGSRSWGAPFSSRFSLPRVFRAAALLLAISAFGGEASAQDEVDLGSIPPRQIVDVPTAGVVPRGVCETQTRLYPGGGVEARIEVGILGWLSLGGAYGAQQVIGDGDPVWNPRPGLTAKIRVFEESYAWPAIAVGIDTQGSGFYDEERERYQFKSRGPWIVASKNYAWLGDVTFHGGVSRSLEDRDDGNPTVFGALDKSLGPYVGLGFEYDAALNDDSKNGVYGRGRGYMNAALRIALAPEVEVRIVLRDLLRNTERESAEFSDLIEDEGAGREFQLSYRVEL